MIVVSERAGGQSEAVTEHFDPRAASEDLLMKALAEKVNHHQYPCLGARAVFRRDRATVRVYDQLAHPVLAPILLEDLRQFASTTDPRAAFVSFVAVFRAPAVNNELHFEELLWSQLRQLHEADDGRWNGEVSADPSDEHFAFSAAGTAYFVVGLHPKASRDARRTPMATLVFNLHAQFELLRASGQFSRMRDKIRQRDEQLQGTTNPMVADHGACSEARQYSGRRVGPGWEAPFQADDEEWTR
jgi:FPC/CPF motif-containing protein YcgG